CGARWTGRPRCGPPPRARPARVARGSRWRPEPPRRASAERRARPSHRVHTLVRRYIKTAILFLAAGLAIGGWIVVRRELFARYPNPYAVSAHTHAILVGFVMMMILGVALWLFPRPEKDDARYSPRVSEV